MGFQRGHSEIVIKNTYLMELSSGITVYNYDRWCIYTAVGKIELKLEVDKR